MDRVHLIASFIVITALFPGSGSASAEAASGAFAAGVESDTRSRYVFRGVPYSQGPVKQTITWLNIKNFDIYSLGTVVLGHEPKQGRFTEIDVGLSYTREWRRFRWTQGLDCYYYRGKNAPAPAPPTCEVSTRFRYSFGTLSLFTEQMVDTRSYRGAYYGEAGVFHEHALSRRTALHSSLRLGWSNAKFNRSYAGLPGTAFNLIGIDVSVTHTFDGHFYLKPHMELAAPPRHSSALVSFGLAIGYQWD